MTKHARFRRTAFSAAALISLALVQPVAHARGINVAAGDVNGDAAYRGGVKVAVSDVNFIGRDGNWFNPSNWSSGRVPGRGDTVILDGEDRVVIDPKSDPNGYVIELEDLIISSVASLEVLPGAVVRSRHQVVRDRGTLTFRAAGDFGESLVVERDSSAVTLVQNPNPKTKRVVVLQSSVTLDMGLGGTAAAAGTDVDGDGRGDIIVAGIGHHATMTVDTLVLDGDLKLSTYYGFEPRPGQSFQIATVNGVRSGEFIGIPEGGYVGCTENDIGLRLSYVGGDGNDLVISAEATDPSTCLLLPAVQKVREAAARSTSTATSTLDLAIEPPVSTIGLLLPAVQKVREAAARSTSTATSTLDLAIEPPVSTIGLLLPAVQKVREAAAR